MGIFAIATLAGFLLFGWIKASQKNGDLFLKPWVQGVLSALGLLALFVLALFVIVLTTQWPSYDVFRIVQDLTGRETAQFILGGVFGCILRHWGTDLWTIKIEAWTKLNWVAISLVGLILLAATVPHIGSLLRDWGMTGLKTPIAEFQFAGQGKGELPEFEKGLQIVSLSKPQTIELLGSSFIQVDLDYLQLFPKDKSAKHKENYEQSQHFAKAILHPLVTCTLEAYTNHLHIESIRHELIRVAQRLRLLIHSKPSPNSTIGPLLKAAKKSFTELQKEVREKDKCEWNESNTPSDSNFLPDAPHIYLALAYLDQFNDNRRGAISILEEASEKFGDDHSPGILFNIHTSLFLFLREEDIRDRKSIFRYLDKALDITQDTGSRLNELKDASLDSDKLILLKHLKRYFEILKAVTKNSLAYVSAEEGIRKFEALQYANHNYRHRNKLPMDYWPPIIDTYGYVKMAFEARKNYPNLYEIKEARALFKEAISHMEEDPADSVKKSLAMKGLRTHLERANRLLEYE